MDADSPSLKRCNQLFRMAIGVLLVPIIVLFTLISRFGTKVLSSPAMIGMYFILGLCLFLSLMATYVYRKEIKIAKGEAKPFFSKQEKLSKKQQIVFLIAVTLYPLGIILFVLYSNPYVFSSSSGVIQAVYLILGLFLITALGIVLINLFFKEENKERF